MNDKTNNQDKTRQSAQSVSWREKLGLKPKTANARNVLTGRGEGPVSPSATAGGEPPKAPPAGPGGLGSAASEAATPKTRPVVRPPRR